MKNKLTWIFLTLGFIGLLTAYLCGNRFGIEVGKGFGLILWEMLKILPCAIILIALFETWCKRETVEKHLGDNSGVRGYLWALALGSMTIGGLFVAFPMAYSLHRKGASLKVIFTFLGFAGVCRIPMTLFEISFLGPKFTFIRLATAIPAMLVTGILIGRSLEKRKYSISE